LTPSSTSKVDTTAESGNPYWRGRLNTVDLLVLTSLDQLLLKLKILFTLLTKWAILTRRSTVLSIPLQLVFPVLMLALNKTLFLKMCYHITPQDHCQYCELTLPLASYLLDVFYMKRRLVTNNPRLLLMIIYKKLDNYNSQERKKLSRLMFSACCTKV
jgi:hypothetical protein